MFDTDVELSDEQLDQVAGGWWWAPVSGLLFGGAVGLWAGIMISTGGFGSATMEVHTDS